MISVAGVFTNGLLIYCIRRHTKLSLGAYKHLLTIFASFDMFLTLLHALVDPVPALHNHYNCDHFQKIFIVNSTFGISSNSDLLPVDRVIIMLCIGNVYFIPDSPELLRFLLLGSICTDEHPFPLSLLDRISASPHSTLLL